MYDSIYIAFLKWQNYREERQMIGCWGLGMGGLKGGGYKRTTWQILMAMKLYSILTAVMHTLSYTYDKICTELNLQTHIHTSLSRTGEIWIRSLYCLILISWVWYCIIITQDITTGGSWVKHTQDLPLLFIVDVCE